MSKVKFCGITRDQDAQAAVRLGVDAVGFVFAASSLRFISPEQAAIMRGRLPATVQAVALFRNPAEAEVRRVIELIAPDLLQFHGEETPGFCEKFGLPYWRAVPMGGVVDLGAWERRFASAAALLLDAHAPAQAGGQGRTFDWSAIRATRPYVLAGGLNPANVGEAVKQLRPWMVDVSTGIESAPGLKDEAKMRQFIDSVRRANP
ncbi:MAG TPA: phosphoribosylanthranilate isomerase [Verrucomicrobiae bacterium]|nr:phosphoribosylanthranilate isomerase [Verrucomicrobiae bacterium]